MRRRNRPARALLVLLVLAVGLSLGVWLVLQRELGRPVRVFSDRPSSGQVPQGHFRVRPGEGLGTVAERLAREGWVNASWPIRFESRRRNWDRRIIPGWYRIDPGESVGDFLRSLAAGEIEQTRVTIPEGWRLSRILEVLSDSTWNRPDSLAAVAGDASWLAAQGVPGSALEGFLFPDTYRIPKGESPRRILEQLLDPGRKLWADSLAAPAARRGLSRLQVWTLASIIEAEAARPEERRQISSVFWNRLRLGMRLESDPTVLYALGRNPGRVLYVDLEVDSPYNTYRSAGLPPGPICSPGRASLVAAVYPDSTRSDLFFVARGDGSHVFSRSLGEHNRAREAIRRENRISGG